MNRLAPIFLITLFLSISAFSQSSVKIGSKAPAFTGNAVDGTTYDLAQSRGRVVVLTFWSSRCSICHSELPKLNRLAGQYDDVAFLALTMETAEVVSPYLQRNPFRFQVLPNSFGVVLRYADRDQKGNIDMGFPSFFVIDGQGLVQHRSSGYNKIESLDAAIGRLTAR